MWAERCQWLHISITQQPNGTGPRILDSRLPILTPDYSVTILVATLLCSSIGCSPTWPRLSMLLRSGWFCLYCAQDLSINSFVSFFLDSTNKWYWMIFVWITSFSMRISSSIYVAADGIISFFLWQSNIPLCICIYPFIYWWTFRLLPCLTYCK